VRVWAAATDTRNGTEIEIFKSEEAMQAWLIDQIGGDLDEWKASGQDLCDYLEGEQDSLDTYTWTYEDIEP
jgi:hypothetical protein